MLQPFTISIANRNIFLFDYDRTSPDSINAALTDNERAVYAYKLVRRQFFLQILHTAQTDNRLRTSPAEDFDIIAQTLDIVNVSSI